MSDENNTRKKAADMLKDVISQLAGDGNCMGVIVLGVIDTEEETGNKDSCALMFTHTYQTEVEAISVMNRASVMMMANIAQKEGQADEEKEKPFDLANLHAHNTKQ